ncbi:MAG TPA: hypothetical protein VFQ74_04020 [Pseudolysinimonas sp.]|nr:hypothetical protein [Pseudolysinimonas sp.]
MTTLSASPPLIGPRAVWARRIAQLLGGLFLYGIGLALMVRAGIGVAPWDVLSQGISLRTGIPFGLVTNIVGALVLLLWIPIRVRVGVGTVANVLLIGTCAQLGLSVIPQQTIPALQALVFAGGLALVAVATGLYIGARLGPGPRDGLMTGLHRRTGWPIWIVRTSIEVIVLGVGWALGGQFGIGTIAFALLIGPMVGVTLPLLRIPEAAPVANQGEEVTP